MREKVRESAEDGVLRARASREARFMIGFRTFSLIAIATLLGAPVTSYDVELAHKSTWPAPAGALSIMSYNIKGLPWPIAGGRQEAISAMGQRLAAMRSSNVQPHVVL